ncbi:MAG TPA: isoprenylcysteine carboxylmethyltransferase family protein [Candidatus Limnocylindrales bacterium]
MNRISNIPLPEQNLTAIAAGLVLQWLRPWRMPGSKRVHRVAGGLVAAAGAGLIARSWAAAGQVDLARPGRLVTSGPYALSRNPMYVGWSLLQLGLGVASRNAWLAAMLPVAAGWIHREVLREERVLASSFGDDYARYRAKVPRYAGSVVLLRGRDRGAGVVPDVAGVLGQYRLGADQDRAAEL